MIDKLKKVVICIKWKTTEMKDMMIVCKDMIENRQNRLTLGCMIMGAGLGIGFGLGGGLIVSAFAYVPEKDI